MLEKIRISTWLNMVKFVQSDEYSADIIDEKFLHSFLLNDRDFGMVDMVLRKKKYFFVPQEY